jgi:hypothetical protein
MEAVATDDDDGVSTTFSAPSEGSSSLDTTANKETVSADASLSSEKPAQASATTSTTSTMTTEEVRQQASKIVVPKEKSTTQESIYKTIMKRLNTLEVNATLSQRYLDDQHKMLNDVLIDMEKRHQEQLMMLIGHLNEAASHKIDSMVNEKRSS